jgi:uncharacterized membrane protein HdeD (DUF308 family)
MGKGKDRAMDRDWLNVSWKMLLVRGVIAIVFGIIAIAWPIETAIAFALLWGIWALVDGIGSLVQAFQPGATTGSRLLLIVMGVIALVAAFFAILSPGVAAVTLTWILGIWLIVRGVFELAGAFAASTSTPRWLLVLSALIDIVLGILFAANPGKGAVGIAVVLGIVAIAWGAAFIAAGFVMRKHFDDFTGPDALPTA